ncbi:MAG: hypothetical protein ACLR8P_12055 [Clostridium fessum]
MRFDEDRKEALEYGMNGFLSKPIVVEELIDALQKIFHRGDTGSNGKSNGSI